MPKTFLNQGSDKRIDKTKGVPIIFYKTALDDWNDYFEAKSPAIPEGPRISLIYCRKATGRKLLILFDMYMIIICIIPDYYYCQFSDCWLHYLKQVVYIICIAFMIYSHRGPALCISQYHKSVKISNRRLVLFILLMHHTCVLLF